MDSFVVLRWDSSEGVRRGRVSLPPGERSENKGLLAVHCRTRSFDGKKGKKKKHARFIINHRHWILREIRGVECHLLGLERVRRVRWNPIFEENARHVL